MILSSSDETESGQIESEYSDEDEIIKNRKKNIDKENMLNDFKQKKEHLYIYKIENFDILYEDIEIILDNKWLTSEVIYEKKFE